jgi:hypothetical protein
LARHKDERRDFTLLEPADNETDEVLGGDLIDTIVPETNTDSVTGRIIDDAIANFTSQEIADGGVETGSGNGSDGVMDSIKSDNEENGEDYGKGDCCSGMGASEVNAKTQKLGLSARDRRLIKKYGSLEVSKQAAKLEEHNKAQPNKHVETTRSTAPKVQNALQSEKRGKKGKQKKATKKYADQDNEDRELAMLALQGGEKMKKKKRAQRGKANRNETEKQEQVAAETMALLTKDSSETAKSFSEQVLLLLAECVTVKNPGTEEEVVVRWEKFDADILEQLLGLESNEAQEAAAQRLLQLKQTSRVDNFSASLAGKLFDTRLS